MWHNWKMFHFSTLFRNVSERTSLHSNLMLDYLRMLRNMFLLIQSICCCISSALESAAADVLSDFPSREAPRDISSGSVPLLPTRRHSISKGMVIRLRGVIKKFVMSQGRGLAYLSLHTEMWRHRKRQSSAGTSEWMFSSPVVDDNGNNCHGFQVNASE